MIMYGRGNQKASMVDSFLPYFLLLDMQKHFDRSPDLL